MLGHLVPTEMWLPKTLSGTNGNVVRLHPSRAPMEGWYTPAAWWGVYNGSQGITLTRDPALHAARSGRWKIYSHLVGLA